MTQLYDNMSSSSSFPQSAPLTYALAALGGVLEVFATAVLAYPDARDKQGITVSPTTQRLALLGNILLQILASLSGNLFATWFGPVSLVGPMFFSAQLVANMIIFGFVLGLENMTHEMQVGTYVIVVATILLPIVGPGIQEGQDAQELLQTPHAIVWSLILVVSMFGSAVFVFGILKMSHYSECIKILILIIARSTCFTLNLTASRAFILEPDLALIIASVAVKIISGAIYTWAIVVQSTQVVQSKFVPLNAVSLMLVNAITGIVIWEDWRVVESWVGYVCVFLLLALASFLLLSSTPLMTSENPEYGQKAHFRRQLMRSTAMRFTVEDLAGISGRSSLGGGDESGVEEQIISVHSARQGGDREESERIQDESGRKEDYQIPTRDEKEYLGEEVGGEERCDLTSDTQPIEMGEEAMTNVEAPVPPRPRLERALTRREAWQSLYHLDSSGKR